MEKRWKLIPNTNYSISDHGDLRFMGFTISYGCDLIVTEDPIEVTPHINRKGYKIFYIRDFEGKSIYLKRHPSFIHRLVATAFLEVVPGKNSVNHIDGNKLNNYYENLEWTTPAENTSHAFRTGLLTYPIGFKNKRTILKKDTLSRINEIERLLEFPRGYIALKRTHNRTRIKGLKKLIKPDFTSPRFKNAHQDFVNMINTYIQKGYHDNEIEGFLSLPSNYIAEMRRLKKFNKFTILKGSRHKKLSPQTIIIIKQEIAQGLTRKDFLTKYQIDPTVYYKIKKGIYTVAQKLTKAVI
jgi:hypothetical protein